MLVEAQAIRAAYPNINAMGELPVTALPTVEPGDSDPPSAYRAALKYLYDEMLFVRAGKATDLTVLDDEIACVEMLIRQT